MVQLQIHEGQRFLHMLNMRGGIVQMLLA